MAAPALTRPSASTLFSDDLADLRRNVQRATDSLAFVTRHAERRQGFSVIGLNNAERSLSRVLADAADLLDQVNALREQMQSSPRG